MALFGNFRVLRIDFYWLLHEFVLFLSRKPKMCSQGLFLEASGMPILNILTTQQRSIPDVDTYKYPQRFSQEF